MYHRLDWNLFCNLYWLQTQGNFPQYPEHWHYTCEPLYMSQDFFKVPKLAEEVNKI